MCDVFIPLSNGGYATIGLDSLADVLAVSLSWRKDRHGYAIANNYGGSEFGGKSTISMHRVVCRTSKGLQTDHINHNKLDNRAGNLRAVTARENNANIRPDLRQKPHFKGTPCMTYRSVPSHGYTGVHLHKGTGKWQAATRHQGKSIYIGLFDTLTEAAWAREAMIDSLPGCRAPRNYPTQGDI